MITDTTPRLDFDKMKVNQTNGQPKLTSKTSKLMSEKKKINSKENAEKLKSGNNDVQPQKNNPPSISLNTNTVATKSISLPNPEPSFSQKSNIKNKEEKISKWDGNIKVQKFNPNIALEKKVQNPLTDNQRKTKHTNINQRKQISNRRGKNRNRSNRQKHGQDRGKKLHGSVSVTNYKDASQKTIEFKKNKNHGYNKNFSEEQKQPNPNIVSNANQFMSAAYQTTTTQHEYSKSGSTNFYMSSGQYSSQINPIYNSYTPFTRRQTNPMERVYQTNTNFNNHLNRIDNQNFNKDAPFDEFFQNNQTFPAIVFKESTQENFGTREEPPKILVNHNDGDLLKMFSFELEKLNIKKQHFENEKLKNKNSKIDFAKPKQDINKIIRRTNTLEEIENEKKISEEFTLKILESKIANIKKNKEDNENGIKDKVKKVLKFPSKQFMPSKFPSDATKIPGETKALHTAILTNMSKYKGFDSNAPKSSAILVIEKKTSEFKVKNEAEKWSKPKPVEIKPEVKNTVETKVEQPQKVEEVFKKKEGPVEVFKETYSNEEIFKVRRSDIMPSVEKNLRGILFEKNGRKVDAPKTLMEFRNISTQKPLSIRDRKSGYGYTENKTLYSNRKPFERFLPSKRFGTLNNIPRVFSNNKGNIPAIEKPKFASSDNEEEKLKNKFKSILNKLSKDNLDRLFKRIIEAINETGDKKEFVYEALVESIIMKAVNEEGYSDLYAKMLQNLNNKFKGFKIKNEAGEEKELMLQKRFIKTIDCTFHKNYALETSKNVSPEKMRKVKRQTLGSIKFVGELFLIRLIPAGIVTKQILRIIRKEENSEKDFEVVCKLLVTTGAKLDKISMTDKKIKKQLEEIFSLINGHMDRLPNGRIRFLLVDMMDLKARKWIKGGKIVQQKQIAPKRFEHSSSAWNKDTQSGLDILKPKKWKDLKEAEKDINGFLAKEKSDETQFVKILERGSWNDKETKIELFAIVLKEVTNVLAYGTREKVFYDNLLVRVIKNFKIDRAITDQSLERIFTKLEDCDIKMLAHSIFTLTTSGLTDLKFVAKRRKSKGLKENGLFLLSALLNEYKSRGKVDYIGRDFCGLDLEHFDDGKDKNDKSIKMNLERKIKKESASGR